MDTPFAAAATASTIMRARDNVYEASRDIKMQQGKDRRWNEVLPKLCCVDISIVEGFALLDPLIQSAPAESGKGGRVAINT